MVAPRLVPRLVRRRLLEALEDDPVVLVHGPRQSGKTTLVQGVGDASDRTYVTFDDDVLRASAEADPIGFVRSLPDRVTLDEVQRVPQIFTTLKATIDRDRAPGRFLLTGSANVFAVPRLADSLAGRMTVLRLYPLAQVELEATDPRFLDRLFAGAFAVGPFDRSSGASLAERIVAGGFPPALARPSERRRQRWYRDYVDAVTQRDVRDLARITALDALPRLMEVVAGQTARLINVSDLAAPFALARPTIDGYLTLLRHVFLVDELPAWHRNRLKRLVKAAKLHIGDTGIGAAVLGVGSERLGADRHLYGQLLETFVFQELRRQASGRDDDVRFFHYRDRDGYEVDVVLERNGAEVAGIEVKGAATVTDGDFAGLRRLERAAGRDFKAGVVLYDGDACLPFGDRMYAVPIHALWRDEPGGRSRGNPREGAHAGSTSSPRAG
ncbi:MAG: ATP-binding protein [Trueperaceae bacterium]